MLREFICDSLAQHKRGMSIAMHLGPPVELLLPFRCERSLVVLAVVVPSISRGPGD